MSIKDCLVIAIISAVCLDTYELTRIFWSLMLEIGLNFYLYVGWWNLFYISGKNNDVVSSLVLHFSFITLCATMLVVYLSTMQPRFIIAWFIITAFATTIKVLLYYFIGGITGDEETLALDYVLAGEILFS